jgi:alpha-tubulin suppressor-like RCC1 family protein
MSLRQMFAGSIVKPGFNPLAPSTYTYNYNLFSWGTSSSNGVLGLANTTNYSSPKQVGALTNWLKIAAGDYLIAALKSDGTIWAWGQNTAGGLGLNNTTNYSSPKQIGLLNTWSDIRGANNFCHAIKTNGTLWAWGLNNSGQLGTNDLTYRSSPTQVGALTNWSKLSTHFSASTHAIKTDGSLWAWGDNFYGQAGQGDNSNAYSSPVQIGALLNWLSVSSSARSVLAVKTDGTLWGWGGNNLGQLGLGNRTDYSSPKQVGSLTNWSTVTTSNQYGSMAIKTDGTLWTWGSSGNGQLGLGNTTNYSSPKQVGALTNWLYVAGGYSAVLAIKTDGTVWSWGNNNKGALGLGNTTNYSSPKQIGSLTTWKQSAPSMSYSAAFALG